MGAHAIDYSLKWFVDPILLHVAVLIGSILGCKPPIHNDVSVVTSLIELSPCIFACVEYFWKSGTTPKETHYLVMLYCHIVWKIDLSLTAKEGTSWGADDTVLLYTFIVRSIFLHCFVFFCFLRWVPTKVKFLRFSWKFGKIKKMRG